MRAMRGLDWQRCRAAGAGLRRRALARPRPTPAQAAGPPIPTTSSCSTSASASLRLGDGVRAYHTPEGTCIVLGDFLTTLDVPMKIDLDAKQAPAAGRSRKTTASTSTAPPSACAMATRPKRLPRARSARRPKAGASTSTALGRWFGIGVKAASLRLGPAARIARRNCRSNWRRERAAARRASCKQGRVRRSKACRRSLPYRMWRAPALDFVVSGGVTYRASTGTQSRPPRRGLCGGRNRAMSYDAQVSHQRPAGRQSLRFRAFRSDPDGGLLGPLDATHFEFGDVAGPDQPPDRRRHQRPRRRRHQSALVHPGGFDRTRFEGDLPAGWDAELYRNGQLLAFADAATPALRFRRRPAALRRQSDSISSFTGRRARSGRAARRSMSARTTSRRARPGIGPAQPAGPRPRQLHPQQAAATGLDRSRLRPSPGGRLARARHRQGTSVAALAPDDRWSTTSG